MKDAVMLAEYIRDLGFTPEQVQDFYPTPSTLSTTMYYTEMNPLTGKSVYVPKDPEEKAMQRALIQYKNPANRKLVMQALKMAGREDLIGFDKKCLIRPENPRKPVRSESQKQGGSKQANLKQRNPKQGNALQGTKSSVEQKARNNKTKTIRNVHKKTGSGK